MFDNASLALRTATVMVALPDDTLAPATARYDGACAYIVADNAYGVPTLWRYMSTDDPAPKALCQEGHPEWGYLLAHNPVA